MSNEHVVVFMTAMVVAFLAVDVKLAKDKLPGNTYSEIITDTGNRHPWFRILFVFVWGVLAGHWWW